MTDAQPLKGKVAVVTGAGRGIGQAIAIGYARAGAAVCCTARTESQLSGTVERIEAADGRALAVSCDVTDVESVKRVFAQELAPANICVNELVPGPVLTAFIRGREDQLRAIAAGGEWMKEPEEVLSLALFIATLPLKGPTGQTFSLARREL